MSDMAKKPPADLSGSNELSRLLTRERLVTAGVRPRRSAAGDPDLEALLERVRSVTEAKQERAPAVKAEIVRKLVHG